MTGILILYLYFEDKWLLPVSHTNSSWKRDALYEGQFWYEGQKGECDC